MTLIKRQAAVSQQPLTPSATHYDHRWLLFLIPICLLFFALVFLVWYVLRRRKRQRQRRSVLRNRALVIAEQEKEREREERRLSRGNSRSSRLSRMTSVKSSAKRTKSTRSTNAMTRSDDVKGSIGGLPLEEDEILDEKEAPFTSSDIKDKEADVDVEYMAEACALPVVSALPDKGSSRVRIVEEAKPSRVKRKEVAALPAISSEVLMRDSGSGDLHRGGSTSSSSWDVHRQDSQRSVRNLTSSSSRGSGSNPFATPSTSSAGHEKLSVPPGIDVSSRSSHEGGGLARKLSGMARLRQPSPSSGAGNGNLYRSDSRASRRSSTRSIRRSDIQAPISSSASLAAASWTYVPQADKWKAPSATSPVDVQAEGAKTSVDTSLSPPVGQLSRRPSTGVAGSKFVESFDEE